MSDKEDVHAFLRLVLDVCDEIDALGYDSVDVLSSAPEMLRSLDTISNCCNDVEMRRNTRSFLKKLRRK